MGTSDDFTRTGADVRRGRVAIYTSFSWLPNGTHLRIRSSQGLFPYNAPQSVHATV